MHPLKNKIPISLTQNKFENCKKIRICDIYRCTFSAGYFHIFLSGMYQVCRGRYILQNRNKYCTDTTETDSAELSLDGDWYIPFLN